MHILCTKQTKRTVRTKHTKPTEHHKNTVHTKITKQSLISIITPYEVPDANAGANRTH